MSDHQEEVRAELVRIMASTIGAIAEAPTGAATAHVAFDAVDNILESLDYFAKDARIAELEALTRPFSESELARAERVLNIEHRLAPFNPQDYPAWLRSTIKAVAKALVEDRASSRERSDA